MYRKRFNSDPVKGFSQDSNSVSNLFIIPQSNPAQNIRELCESQKSTTKNIKADIKTNSFNKSQQEEHYSNFKIMKIDSVSQPHLVFADTKTIIKSDVKSKKFTKKHHNPIQNENSKKCIISKPAEEKKIKNVSKDKLQKQNVKSKVATKEQKKRYIKENRKTENQIQLSQVENFSQLNKDISKLDFIPKPTEEKKIKNVSKDKLQKQNAKSKEANKVQKNRYINENRETENRIQLSQIGGFSQPNKDISHRQRLEWLRDRRGVGTYIQCCNNYCEKWRYEPNIKEPIDVPEWWVCSMNSDVTLASCDAPENPINLALEEDMIYNSYTAGSIVWARITGYPWWPAIVDDDPDTEQYFWLDDFSDIPSHYHVAFFDSDTVTRSWIAVKNLKAFKTGNEFTRTKCGKKDYNSNIQFAKTEALEALKFNIQNRLYIFGFLARFEGPIETPLEIDSDSDTGKDEAYDLDTLVQLSHDLSQGIKRSNGNLDTLVQLSRDLSQGLKRKNKRKDKNKNTKLCDKNDDLTYLLKASSESSSALNDITNQMVKNTRKKRKVTAVKLSRDLNSNLNDNLNRYNNSVLKKNNKRKISNDDSSLEFVINSSSKVHQPPDETETITKAVITDSNDQEKSVITSTAIYDDLYTNSLSPNMFDTDEENDLNEY